MEFKFQLIFKYENVAFLSHHIGKAKSGWILSQEKKKKGPRTATFGDFTSAPVAWHLAVNESANQEPDAHVRDKIVHFFFHFFETDFYVKKNLKDLFSLKTKVST
jgi:hypothetical protein